ncbi:uncharacterized protein [Linepithema humile]|uniref:uncharacterized protein isoform X1 n=1 Tax=Linepithema humile TaxID=83485 RepID=UPI00351F2916
MKMEETYDLDTFEEVEEWNESEIRSLITLIKANEFLVNKTNKDFFNKEKKNNAWKIIGNLLHKTEVEVQRKWKSLRTVFSRKLAQLKEKVPSGSGAAKEKSTNIEWEYWGDMQFLIPHMRHKSNRTSNFYKKPFLASSTTSGPLASTTSGLLASPLNNKNSVLKSSSEPFKNTMKCTAPESSLQNTNVIDFEFSNFAPVLTETLNSETLLSSDDSFSHVESLSASSIEQKISLSETEDKKYLSNMKCKRKAPTPDKFHIKKKKELDFCSARMSEASHYLKETLDTVKQSLKEPNGSDDLQYLSCLLPTFKKLNDDLKTECLMTLLNVVKEYGSKNKQQ